MPKPKLLVHNSKMSADEHSKLKAKSQLIGSRCRCEFYMIDFNDKILVNVDNLEDNLIDSQALLNSKIDLNSSFNEPINCFTLIHYDLKIRTNSQQYKIILDIVNNLVLYFRPKNLTDKKKTIKFNLTLKGDTDATILKLKEKIQKQQADIKDRLCKLRLLERSLFYSTGKIEMEINGFQPNAKVNRQHMNVIQELRTENNNLEKEYTKCKQELNECSDVLNIDISCYTELMLEKHLNDSK
jgi:hypothetical protein